jgi:hypothetical protein
MKCWISWRVDTVRPAGCCYFVGLSMAEAVEAQGFPAPRRTALDVRQPAGRDPSRPLTISAAGPAEAFCWGSIFASRSLPACPPTTAERCVPERSWCWRVFPAQPREQEDIYERSTRPNRIRRATSSPRRRDSIARSTGGHVEGAPHDASLSAWRLLGNHQGFLSKPRYQRAADDDGQTAPRSGTVINRDVAAEDRRRQLRRGLYGRAKDGPAAWPSRSSSWAWTPSRLLPASRPNARPWP